MSPDSRRGPAGNGASQDARRWRRSKVDRTPYRDPEEPPTEAEWDALMAALDAGELEDEEADK